MTTDVICEKCGGDTYMQLDKRTWCPVNDPKRKPILKCMRCDMKVKNCECDPVSGFVAPPREHD